MIFCHAKFNKIISYFKGQRVANKLLKLEEYALFYYERLSGLSRFLI